MTYKPDYCIRYIKPSIPMKAGDRFEDPLGLLGNPIQLAPGDMKWLSIEDAKAQGIDIREATPEEIAELLPRMR